MSISITAVGLVSLGGTIAALASDAIQSSKTRERLLRAARRPEAVGPPIPARPLHHRSGQRIVAWIARGGERVSALMGGETKDKADDLRVAGFRGCDALLVYAFVKTVLPGGAALTGVTSVVLSGGPLAVMLVPIGTVLALALALSKGVGLVMGRIRQTRLKRIARGIPDLLELLVINSEAGLGPQPALQRVAAELAEAHPDLAQ